MTYGDHRLFLYDNIIDVVITTSMPNLYRDNRTMNKKVMVAHKGVANEFYINIRNRDRKLQNVFVDVLRAYIVHPTTKARILARELEHTTDIGKSKLTIYPADIAGLAAGLYHLYITRSTSETEDLPLYTDQNDNMRFDIKVTDQVTSAPVPTQTATTFIQQGNTSLGDAANTFVTSAFEGNLERNFTDARHTVAVFPNAYEGQVTIQASCLGSVPSSDDESDDWFDVVDLDFTGNSNVAQVTNFVTNCEWVRAVLKPSNDGSITKIELRN